MVREIKFRGKRTDNREWVYGYYVIKAGMPFILSFGVIEPILVIPETVGQFIGNCNGIDVYEGDIVERGDGRRDFIIYENGCFTTKNEGWTVDWLFRHRMIELEEDIKIIGNIHDNLTLITLESIS